MPSAIRYSSRTRFFFGLIVGVGAGLPRLDGLETRRPRHATGPAGPRGRCPRPPLRHQVVGQFRQAPRRERQPVIARPRERDLLDRRALVKVELRRRPPPYLGRNESNPSALKLWITSRTRSGLVNVTCAIFATSMPWADSEPSAPDATSPPTPTTTHDLQQPVALNVADLPDMDTLRH